MPKMRTYLSIILGLLVLLAILSFDPKPFMGGDNAAYMILAKSISQGTGYKELWTPGTPRHTSYPPGFPLMLAPFWVLPHPLIAMKLFIMGLGLLCIILVHRLFRNNYLTALFAISPVFVEFSHWVLSEIPYLAVSLLALWLLSGKGWRFRVGVLAVAATFYVRTIGIALVVAVPVYFLLMRRWKDCGLSTLCLAVLISPWLLWGRGGGYGQQFFLLNPYDLSAGFATLPQFGLRIWQNLLIYGINVIPGFIFPFGGVLILGLLVLGFVVGIRRGVQIWQIYLLAYLVIALLWPPVWSDRRFLLPVLPLLLCLFISGVFSIRPRIIGKALIGLSALSLLWGTLSIIPNQVRDNIAYLHGDEFAGYPNDFREFYQMADKISVEPGTKIICRKPTLLYLRTGLQSTWR